MKRALISGGGIAGLTLAYWLAQDNWDISIVERAPAMRTDGYMIDFFGGGWAVAERMGLVEKMEQIRYPIASLQYVNASGIPYLTVPVESVKHALDGRYTFLLRSDLVRLLRDVVGGQGLEVMHGNSVLAIEDDGSGVSVSFEDGGRDRYDIVIGADGVHSGVRRLVFGDDREFMRPLPYALAAFHIPHRYDSQDRYAIYVEPGRQLMLYPHDDGSSDTIFIFAHSGRDLPMDGRKDLLVKTYKGAGWIVGKVLGDVREEDITFLDTLDQTRMPAWSKGRVVLSGDSCACMTILAGQGASMAMEESYVLAKQLKIHGSNYSEAFRAYESLVRPEVEKHQNQAKRFASIAIPTTALGLWASRRMIKVGFGRAFIKKTVRSIAGKSLT